jgi:hypothetical protein
MPAVLRCTAGAHFRLKAVVPVFDQPAPDRPLGSAFKRGQIGAVVTYSNLDPSAMSVAIGLYGALQIQITNP